MGMRKACSLLAMLALASSAWAATPAAQDFQEAVGRTPDAQRGERLYVSCAGCHRANGRGNMDGSVPLIAGQHARVTIKQLADYRHARRWDPRMQHYADNHVLPDVQALADVAAHVAALDRSGTPGVGKGDLLPLGRSLYSAHCAECHGRTGAGDAQALVPRIAGQHYAYLLRQLHDAVDGRRPNFPADHIRLLERFERDGLNGLADAIARMR